MSTRTSTGTKNVEKKDINEINVGVLVSAFTSMRERAPKAWAVFVTFLQGLVYDTMRSVVAESSILIESRHTVGNTTYHQVVGPVEYIVRAIQSMANKTAIIALGIDKYTDRVVMVYHLGESNAKLAMPEDLLGRIFANGCYVPITKIGAIDNKRFIALGGQWLGLQRITSALFQIARVMFDSEGYVIGTGGRTNTNTFLAPSNLMTSTEFATWTVYGPDTAKCATVTENAIMTAAYTDGFLFRTNRETGLTFASAIAGFVDTKDIIWHRIGTFAAKIADIAAIKQADGSIILVGTAEDESLLLIPMKIEDRGGQFIGTIESDLCVKRDDERALPYGSFTGLTAARDGAIFQGTNATTTIGLSEFAGLNKILNPSMRQAAQA